MKTLGLSPGLVTCLMTTDLTLLPTGHDGCGRELQAGVWVKGQEIGAPEGWRMRRCEQLKMGRVHLDFTKCRLCRCPLGHCLRTPQGSCFMLSCPHRIPQRKNRGLRFSLCILSALLWIYWHCGPLSSSVVLPRQALTEPGHPSLCYSDADTLDFHIIQKPSEGISQATSLPGHTQC